MLMAVAFLPPIPPPLAGPEAGAFMVVWKAFTAGDYGYYDYPYYDTCLVWTGYGWVNTCYY
jgi:hypothetical protein